MGTNGLSKMAVATLLLVLAIVPAVVAVTYTVGNANQWASGVDYTVWVTGKTFRIGDTQQFKYGPTHSVDVVDKAGYDGCDGSSATENHSDGDTKIELKTVGTKYFICRYGHRIRHQWHEASRYDHCINGMKLAVMVIASASSPPPSSFPVSPPPTPPPLSPVALPPTPYLPRSDGTHEADSGSTTRHPPPSSGASRGLMSYVVVGISLVLACNVWIMDLMGWSRVLLLLLLLERELVCEPRHLSFLGSV